MPAITIQQAYALALQAYIDPANSTNNGKLTCSSGITGTSTTRLSQLLNSTSKDLGDIVVTKPGGSTTTIISNANTPSGTTYTLVTSSTNANGGVLDYIEGGQIDSTGGTLSTEEANIHKTGRGILKKLK